MTLSQKILVKSRNTCLKTGHIIGVSEINDLGQEACLIMLYATEPCDRPCVIAQYRLESASMSLAER